MVEVVYKLRDCENNTWETKSYTEMSFWRSKGIPVTVEYRRVDESQALTDNDRKRIALFVK